MRYFGFFKGMSYGKCEDDFEFYWIAIGHSITGIWKMLLSNEENWGHIKF